MADDKKAEVQEEQVAVVDPDAVPDNPDAVQDSTDEPSTRENEDEGEKEVSIEELLALGQGLDENDYKAELDVLQNDPTSPLYAATTFEDLGLPPQNLIGQAQSGSGKTATFALGMLHRVDVAMRAPQALCVGPTRELVRQIDGVVRVMGKFTGITTFLAIPGNDVPVGQKVSDQIVVGTPGKVEFLIKKKFLDCKTVKIFVLDEADEMVKEGGHRDRSMFIKKALERANPKVQILLFSATYADEVRDFAVRIVPNHNIITVKKEQLTLDGIRQFWIDCNGVPDKFRVLSDLYSLVDMGKSVIFVQTRETCKMLTKKMREAGHSVGIIHGGDMDKSVRDKVMDEYRRGTTKVLITTNVLARGIDVLGVSMVVNYDIPATVDGQPDYENYLHRIGRTGRFGRKGVAINLVHDDQSKRLLAAIESYYQRVIIEAPADDLEKLEEMMKME